mmetsp:Transcript_31802/g.28162  ORF Transcript_31802/g.28162 Transcript_31802/m.28162 type:complete len:95 (-) Transcript_31802:958-1242(-)
MIENVGVVDNSTLLIMPFSRTGKALNQSSTKENKTGTTNTNSDLFNKKFLYSKSSKRPSKTRKDTFTISNEKEREVWFVGDKAEKEEKMNRLIK